MRLLTLKEIKRGKYADIDNSKVLRYGKVVFVLYPYFCLIPAFLFKLNVWCFLGIIALGLVLIYHLLYYLVLCDCYIGESTCQK